MTATLSDAVETTGRVTKVGRMGAYVVLTVRAPDVARRTVPGRFVMIGSDCLLRRPFSVYLADGDTISVAFDIIGTGTRHLATRVLGDELPLAGPLGNGFSLDADGPTIAVGGGYGASAMFLFAERLKADGHAVHALFGAATSARVFGADAARSAFDSVSITTEDGSLGKKGLVTDLLDAVAEKTGARRVAACGPMPMLAAVAARCRQLGLACEVATEEFMACGIGVCWTCVVPTSGGGFTRSCTEGPVFDGAEVAWG
jgi:dihydroorotate dehydrogenase electron transfer subunit